MKEPEDIYCTVNNSIKDVHGPPPPLPTRENIPASFIKLSSSRRIPFPPTTMSSNYSGSYKNSPSRTKVILAIAIVILLILSTVFIALYSTTNRNKSSKPGYEIRQNRSTAYNFKKSNIKNVTKKGDHTISSGKELQVYSSCLEAQQEISNAKNGPHRIKDNSTKGFTQTYCQMTSLPGCPEGGWTLVMKINGEKNTFSYPSHFWSNRQSYNLVGGLTGIDDRETKLPSYWTTPFKEMCVGMKVDNQLTFVNIRYSTSSLFALIADGNYRETNLGRKKWKSLICGSSLQFNCSKEGFNVVGFRGWQRVRIGIIGDNENDCDTPDSYVGFGGSLTRKNQRCAGLSGISNSCGNVASCPPYDNGFKTTSASGYIFVR